VQRVDERLSFVPGGSLLIGPQRDAVYTSGEEAHYRDPIITGAIGPDEHLVLIALARIDEPFCAKVVIKFKQEEDGRLSYVADLIIY
jgi:hypothetical protein